MSRQHGKMIMYRNVHRGTEGYKDKYLKGVENELKKFLATIGKTNKDEMTVAEWKRFFKSNGIPLDPDSERHMIELFRDERDELNSLLILHNMKAAINKAEVAYKNYEKKCPNKWHDLEDFKQMAMEGLVIAASRFNIDSNNRFITFASWWMLNRCMKPSQAKGAFSFHVSLSSPINNDDDGKSTFEDVLSPEMIQPMAVDDVDVNPLVAREDECEKSLNSDLMEQFELIRHTTNKKIGILDIEKTENVMYELAEILNDKSLSDADKQIYMYLFKRIFTKGCKVLRGSNDSLCNIMQGYVNSAANTKEQLKSRLGMDSEQYENKCNELLRRGVYAITKKEDCKD